MPQAKFKAAIIVGPCLKACNKKWLNRITGKCGCNVIAKLKSLGDWCKHPKTSTKEAFMVDYGHVTFFRLVLDIGHTEFIKKN